MASTYILERDGQRPLRFTGELIAKSNSHSHQGPNNTRWTEVRLFRTSGEPVQFVAEIKHLTNWQGESETVDVHVHIEPVKLLEKIGETSGGDLAPVVLEAFEEAELDIAEDLN
jgi:hypothetical protein